MKRLERIRSFIAATRSEAVSLRVEFPPDVAAAKVVQALAANHRSKSDWHRPELTVGGRVSHRDVLLYPKRGASRNSFAPLLLATFEGGSERSCILSGTVGVASWVRVFLLGWTTIAITFVALLVSVTAIESVREGPSAADIAFVAIFAAVFGGSILAIPVMLGQSRRDARLLVTWISQQLRTE